MDTHTHVANPGWLSRGEAMPGTNAADQSARICPECLHPFRAHVTLAEMPGIDDNLVTVRMCPNVAWIRGLR